MFLRLVFGTLFPAYYSYKAVKTKNVKEYVSRAQVLLLLRSWIEPLASRNQIRCLSSSNLTLFFRVQVKWMMYWIVFAFFTCFETITDLFLAFWFPFYYEVSKTNSSALISRLYVSCCIIYLSTIFIMILLINIVYMI